MNQILSIYLLVYIVIFNVQYKSIYCVCPTKLTVEEPVPSGSIIYDFTDCISNGDRGSCNTNDDLELSCLDTQKTDSFEIFNRTQFRNTRELDREQRGTYDLKCSFTPLFSTSVCHVFDVLLQINDTNDNGPVFTQNIYYVEMFETRANISEEISSGPIVTDSDTGINAEYELELRYLNLSEQNIFELTTKTDLVGIILIQNIRELDRERQDQYDLKLLATDKQNRSMSSSALLTITILDQNDNPPVFLNDSTVTINVREDQEKGSKVGHIVADDQDISPNNQINFYISDSCVYTRISKPFVLSIDPLSGVLTLNRSVDVEEGDERFITQIVAVDPTNSIYFNCIILDVNIIDVNDNIPMIMIMPFIHSLDENRTYVGISILRVSVSDVDNDANGKVDLNFSCEFSNCNCDLTDCKQHFELIEFGPTLYRLTLVEALDYEKSDKVNITFTATDNGPTQRYNTKQFILSVNPINEYSPTFERMSYNCPVMENLEVGDPFCTEVASTDFDIGLDGEIIYSIIPETAFPSIEEISEYFEFDEEKNSLVLLKKLDFENLNSGTIFSFQLKASNHDFKFTITNVTIEIKDVNDNDPHFTNIRSSYTVQENVPVGTPITSLFGEDLDSGEKGEINIYIQQSDNSNFKIDHSTSNWVLQTNGTLDREVASSYNLNLVIKDNGIPSRTSQQNVIIYIEDINDNRPFFSKPIYEFQLLEVNDAWTIEVEDPDSYFIGQFRLDFGKFIELSSALKLNEIVPSIIFKDPTAIQPGSYPFIIYVGDQSLSNEENSTTLILEYRSDTTVSSALPSSTLRAIIGSAFAALLLIIISVIVIIVCLIIYAVKRNTGNNAYKLQVHRRIKRHNGTSGILKPNPRFQDSKNSKKVSFNGNVQLMTFSLPEGSTSESTSASSSDISNEERTKKGILQWPISSKHDAQNFIKNPRAVDSESWIPNALSNPIYDTQTYEVNTSNNPDVSHGHYTKDSNVPLISPINELYSEPHDILIVNPHTNYPKKYLPHNAYEQAHSSTHYTDPIPAADYGATIYDPAEIMPDMLDSETTTDSEKPPHGAVPIYISSDMTSEGEFSAGLYSDNDTSISNQAQYCMTNIPSDSFDGDLTM